MGPLSSVWILGGWRQNAGLRRRTGRASSAELCIFLLVARHKNTSHGDRRNVQVRLDNNFAG